MKDQEMGFYFRPLRPGSSFLIDIPSEDIPDLTEGAVLEVNSVNVIPQYKTSININ